MMPRYAITLEAYVYAPSPEEAENRWYDGDVKAYVIQVDEVDVEAVYGA
jgi:hypothetical protein